MPVIKRPPEFFRESALRNRFDRACKRALGFKQLNEGKKESDQRLVEEKLPVAAPVKPGSLPPRRHDPEDPECVCDLCDPE